MSHHLKLTADEYINLSILHLWNVSKATHRYTYTHIKFTKETKQTKFQALK